jgi:cardiolipin synthase
MPTLGSTPAERFFALSIAGARRTLYISNSYFVPSAFFCELLERAARRGVDVRLLTASSQTDVKLAWWAGRARYEELLAAGVRIYEYQPAMMHAKTFVVDGLCSTIGALNLDNRSIILMDETSLIVMDDAVGASMDRLFLEDLRSAEEIHLETFRKRPWRNRLPEQGATLLSRLL